jgi:thymidine phosphorylase
LDIFRKMVKQQGGDQQVVGDVKHLPRARKQAIVAAPRDGFVVAMDAFAVGTAAMLLGAGRQTAKGKIDPGVGIRVRAKPGEAVRAGEPVYEVAYNRDTHLSDSLRMLETSYKIGDAPPRPSPLLLDTIR